MAAGLLRLRHRVLLLIPLLIYYGIALTWSLLLLPLFIVLVTLLALGVGMWASALNVRYRDVRYALPFTIQLWLFASPVIYPSSIMPATWKWVLLFNPMTGIIEGFRSSLFGRGFDWTAILAAAALTLIFFFYSAYFFRRVEETFADVV